MSFFDGKSLVLQKIIYFAQLKLAEKYYDSSKQIIAWGDDRSVDGGPMVVEPHCCSDSLFLSWHSVAGNYGALDELARSCVNTHKIEQHWDDMMRIAGSLKLGTVQASELIRSPL